MLLVAGDAGIGKTRLTAELARDAHAWGATVLYGRAHPGAIAPYAPFVEALRPFLASCAPGEARALGGPLAGELARLVPDQADRLPPPGAAPAADREDARYRLFAACSAFVAGAARTRALLLVVDDLHLADRSTVALFRHLAAGEPAPLLIVGTYRQGELGDESPVVEALAALRRGPGFEGVALEGMPAEAVGVIASAWLGAGAPSEVTDSLAEFTGGNPFFVEELSQLLAGAAGRRGGRTVVHTCRARRSAGRKGGDRTATGIAG